VLVLALNDADVYVGDLDQSVLRDLAELGMDIHDNVRDDPAWDHGLSWELVGELPADLIIWDDRPRFRTPDQLAGNPVWASLPAVRAGQLVGYPFDPLFTHAFHAEQYQRLAAAVEQAEAGLA
jgi:iron complex transport system substrate-binding protein